MRSVTIDGDEYVCCNDFFSSYSNPRKVAGKMKTRRLCKWKTKRGLHSYAFAKRSEMENFKKYRARKTQVHGQLYLFTTVGNSRILKAGRTKNWRQRNYVGLNKPRDVIFVRDVENMRKSENALIEYLKKQDYFIHRVDLGEEWFETDLTAVQIKCKVNQMLF